MGSEFSRHRQPIVSQIAKQNPTLKHGQSCILHFSPHNKNVYRVIKTEIWILTNKEIKNTNVASKIKLLNPTQDWVNQVGGGGGGGSYFPYILLKCYYDQITDIHFFTFSCTI